MSLVRRHWLSSVSLVLGVVLFGCLTVHAFGCHPETDASSHDHPEVRGNFLTATDGCECTNFIDDDHMAVPQRAVLLLMIALLLASLGGSTFAPRTGGLSSSLSRMLTWLQRARAGPGEVSLPTLCVLVQ